MRADRAPARAAYFVQFSPARPRRRGAWYCREL